MDTRTRWVIGLLVALVIGLAGGLIIVAGDSSDDASTTVTVKTGAPRQSTPGNATLTEPTTSNPTGGTPAPPAGGDSDPPNGSGGL
jgi:hypothetical protein